MTTSNPEMPATPAVEEKTPPKGPRKLTKAEIRATEAKTKLTSPWATGTVSRSDPGIVSTSATHASARQVLGLIVLVDRINQQLARTGHR